MVSGYMQPRKEFQRHQGQKQRRNLGIYGDRKNEECITMKNKTYLRILCTFSKTGVLESHNSTGNDKNDI